ncbi:MAG TPA: 50S ribosomal protein L35 [Candidatus Saccharibacteria bacterium]|mgnify:CR=1 FL=1|nr:50S ribosomal protein L35 [Candidatus Saccharibacteria bacterium]
MPKLKTHRGTAKRIRVTATGKLLRRRAFGNHFLAGKSASRKRVIGTSATLSGKHAKNVKRAVGA